MSVKVTRFNPDYGFQDEELITLFHVLEEGLANAISCETEDKIESLLKEVNLELVVRGVFAW